MVLCDVPLDLIVLTGGLCTTWDVILALEVTVGGRWVRTCGDEAVCPHTQEQCSDHHHLVHLGNIHVLLDACVDIHVLLDACVDNTSP